MTDPMQISPETRLYIETRAICLMGEKGREAFLEPTPALIKIIAEKLMPYADDIKDYGKPPTMEAAWIAISDDIGTRTGQINMDMIDIASIHRAATQYVASPDAKLVDIIQRSRSMLRSQAIYPQLRKLGEAAAIAVSQPDFKKGSFTPSL